MSKANRVKRSKFLSLFSIERIKSEILGETYELSFAFIETPEMQKLNKEYRGKDYPTDILSFPLSDTAGEILICKEVAKEKSKDFDTAVECYKKIQDDYPQYGSQKSIEKYIARSSSKTTKK